MLIYKILNMQFKCKFPDTKSIQKPYLSRTAPIEVTTQLTSMATNHYISRLLDTLIENNYNCDDYNT